MQNPEIWPDLSYEKSKDTYETIHLWTQIVGKIKLMKMPWINHSWHITFLLSPTGLTTGTICDRNQNFQIDFDFIEHQLKVSTSQGKNKNFSLIGISVADFYFEIKRCLKEFDISFDIHKIPSELVDPIPFHKDKIHATYDPDAARDLHLALLKSNEIFNQFRSEFIGKCSPSHFFWGSFDLAVTRFSGRKAPKHPGGVPNLPDWVTREAYSHEVSSCGFWPGNEMVPFAAFYNYHYPEPEGFKNAKVKPESAYYHKDLSEFILPYSEVKKAEDPAKTLLEFMQSTYNAGADLAKWDRENLEK